MYNLIKNTNQSQVNRGKIIDSPLLLELNKLSANIDKAVAYHQETLTPVDSRNPLVRLLTSFLIDIAKPPSTAYARTSEMLPELISSHEIYSHQSLGKATDKLVYGQPSVMVASSDYSLAKLLGINWRNIEPVKILSRPGIKGIYTRPDLARIEEGLIIVSVDLPALSFMFHRWRKEEQKKPAELRDRYEWFVARYVLPSMIRSQANAILMNLLLTSNEELGTKDKNTTPFYVTEHLKGIREGYMRVVDQIQNGIGTLDGFLQAIPMLYNVPMRDTLLEVNSYKSGHNKWIDAILEVRYTRAAIILTPKNPEKSEIRSNAVKMIRAVSSGRQLEKSPTSIRPIVLGLWDDYLELIKN